MLEYMLHHLVWRKPLLFDSMLLSLLNINGLGLL
ncbi:hypothetical protein Gogos_000702 [Gossypium gossypioides]|uniref:Uncharacterized protein n=1 Tax=Gossypium gossypioides TaxID=34282 RepID=A0A7J9CTS4_GOSGO|nr:hypothetical protein [Gossypium gossypioides]